MWLRAATALPFLLWMNLSSPSEGKDAGEPDVGGTAEDAITKPKKTVESYYTKFAEAVGRKLEETDNAIIAPPDDIEAHSHRSMDDNLPRDPPCLYIEERDYGVCQKTTDVFASVGEVREPFEFVSQSASSILQSTAIDMDMYWDLAQVIADEDNAAILSTTMSALTRMDECPIDEGLQKDRAYAAWYACRDLSIPMSNPSLPDYANGACDSALEPLKNANADTYVVCNAFWYCVKEYRPEEELAIPTILDAASMMLKIYNQGLEAYTGSIQGRLVTYVPYLDFVHERIKNIHYALQMFITSGLDESTMSLRNLCTLSGTSLPSTPKEMFYHIYSFSCGGLGSGRDCESSDFGTCTYGVKKDISLSLFDYDEIREFQKWILSTLVELMYAHTTCLSPDEGICGPIGGAQRRSERMNMLAALNEVIANLRRAEECAKAQEDEFMGVASASGRRLRDVDVLQRELQTMNTTNSSRSLVACVQDPFRNRIDRSDPAYTQGQISDLDITEFEATNQLEFALAVTSDIAAGIGDIAGGFGDTFGKFAGAMGGAGAILSVVSAFVGTKADDITQALIKSLFAEQNAKLDRLGENVNFQFSELRQLIGDVVLDDVMVYLDRQYATFEDYRNIGRLDYTKTSNFYEVERLNSGLVEKYRKQFRLSCNELKYRPEDIVQYLYGHVCGDRDWDMDRCQKSRRGSLAGTCKYGRKQASYLFDEYRKSSDCDPEDGTICENASALYLQTFQNWILGAMAEAIFLQAVCIPLDEKQCPTLNDPIFDTRYKNSIMAYEEAYANIQGAISCSCPCKRVRLIEIKLEGDDAGSYAEARIEINGETRFPCSFSTIGRTGPEPGSPSENPGNKAFCKRGSSVCVYDDGGFGSFCKGVSGERGRANYKFENVRLNSWHPLVAPIELGVFTEASPSFRIHLEEDDSTSGNERLNLDVDFARDLYSNTCGKYIEELSGRDDSGDTWKFKFEMVSLSNSECPASFCSDEFLDCDEVSFCNTTAYTCLPKKSHNETCGSPSQCLSNECLNGQCGQLKSAGEFCDGDAQCLHFNASATGSAGDTFRCTNETGSEYRCGGLLQDGNCTVGTECLSGTCTSQNCA